jgi:hypothetical protein
MKMKKISYPPESGPASGIRKVAFFLIMAGIIVAGTIIGGELIIRIFLPQPNLFPRWEYSPEYGSVFPAETTVISRCPGKWEFFYTINKFGCRGNAIPISDHYDKDNIVVLGDSFSFGQGVNDGEDYPSILAAALNSEFNVINISCPGWGLTQQLRRYYDFGRLYSPRVVILQFSANDLLDNFINRVAVVKEGELSFRNTDRTKGRLKTWISKCFLLQRSQIYCLIRNLYNTELWRKRDEKEAYIGRTEAIPSHEKFYADLLEAFALSLHRSGTRLLMTGPEDSVDWFPYLKKQIDRLEAEGLVTYHRTVPWFDGIEDYGSPEGHSWGRRAHRIVGENLTEVILRKL